MIIGRAAAPLWLLGALARFRLTGDTREAQAASLGATPRNAMQRLPMGDDEREAVSHIADLLSDQRPNDLADGRIAAVVQWSSDYSVDAKAVLFTTFPTVCTTAAAALRRLHGPETVAMFGSGVDAEQAHAELERFRRDHACRFFVCDARGNEGINLQFADALIHIDLPSLPNSLEQRIGRLDRYGDGPPFESLVFVERDDASLADAWLVCLRDGLGVFRRSIASLQFITSHLARDAFDRALRTGAEGLRAFGSELPARVNDELATIAERESLDMIEALDADTSQVEGILAGEARAREFEDACEAIRQTYGLGRVRQPSTPGVANYSARFGVPRHEQPGAIGPDELERRFGETLDRMGTFDREVALALPGTTLRRLGDPFVDRLARLADVDDFGTTFAVWRRDRAWQRGDLLALGCDFVVEPGSVQLGSEDLSAMLQHRARSFLPRRIVTVWINLLLGRVVDELAAIHALTQPAAAAVDTDLVMHRTWPLGHLLPRDEWETTFDEGLETARQAVADDPESTAGRESALSRLERGLESISLQRGVRAEGRRRRLGARISEALDVESRHQGALRTAVARPDIALRACGVVVLSADSPNRVP